MATVPYIANYLITFSDATLYAAAVATYGPYYYGTPLAASAIFGMPYTPFQAWMGGGTLTPPPGIYYCPFPSYPFSAPAPAPPGTVPDPTLNGQVVPGYTSPILGTLPDMVWSWSGTFLLIGGASPGPTATAMAQRRWVDGFEAPSTSGGAEGGGGNTRRWASRASSRTTEGMGLPYRLMNNINRTHTLAQFAAAAKNSWERFYIRLITLPSADQSVWSTTASAEGNPSLVVYVTSTGQLKAYNLGNQAAPGDLLATSAPLTLNTWYRVDQIFKYRTATPGTALYQLYLNRVLVGAASPASGFGLDFNQNHSDSQMGERFSVNFGLECDIDDWMNADPILNGSGVPLLTGLDFTSGSHMRLLRPRSYKSHTDWTGDYRVLEQNPVEGTTNAAVISSSTASARLEPNMDASDYEFGCVAFVVGLYTFSGGGAGAQLGYSLVGGADVLAAITTGAGTWRNMMYRPSGLTTPAAITPLTLIHTKDTAGGAVEVKALYAVGEFLGAFGEVDNVSNPALDAAAPFTGIHNAPYPESMWVQAPAGLAPIGEVRLKGGTYVGNDLGQDVLQTFPGHWWYVRPLSGTTAGHFWVSSAIGTHRGDEQRLFSDLMVRSLENTVGAASQVSGPAGDGNATGVTYQYVAISDPAMRFLLNGAFSRRLTPSPSTEPLIDTGFTPVAGFFLIEEVLGASGGAIWYKGSGHAAAAASPVDGAQDANAVTFGTGTIVTQAVLHEPVNGNLMQTAYSLIRTVEPGGGCSADDLPPFVVTNYTGNGAGDRTIPYVGNGRYPLLAWLIPHNGAGFVRDPSHTGLNSSPIGGGAVTTNAITGDGGAPNQITVASAVNQNGVVYDVFIIPGGSASWANGEFIPVAPCAAKGSVWTSDTPTVPPSGCAVEI